MAELTRQDIDNCNKLKEAFSTLSCSTPDVLQKLTNQLKMCLTKLPKDTDELRRIVDLVDSYLNFYYLLLPDKLADVQDIKTLNEQIDSSLNAVEAEDLNLTDEIQNFSSDNLFLDFLTSTDIKTSTKDIKNWTTHLLANRDPHLNEVQVNQLIGAWSESVQKFVEDAREQGGTVTPLQPETFAHFFWIHSELENLYSSLADTETVQGFR